MGKRSLLSHPRLALLGFVTCLAAAGAPAMAGDEVVDLSPVFGRFRAAMVVRELDSQRTVRHNPPLAATRFSPCSTFKIPNSLIGLESGVIQDASTVLPWDHKPREIEAWNRDHDLRSAIQSSVVWYYQELARRVGPERMQLWLRYFDYGNQDASAGIDRFWLGASLLISPDEQVRFLERFLTGRLPVSERATAIVKDILVQPAPAPGIVYRGKTGSCSGSGSAAPHGWWVGSVENGGRVTVFAALIQGEGATGRACRPLAEKALEKLGVLPAAPAAKKH